MPGATEHEQYSKSTNKRHTRITQKLLCLFHNSGRQTRSLSHPRLEQLPSEKWKKSRCLRRNAGARGRAGGVWRCYFVPALLATGAPRYVACFHPRTPPARSAHTCTSLLPLSTPHITRSRSALLKGHLTGLRDQEGHRNGKSHP